MAVPQDWMPPDMSAAVKDSLAARWPTDPHLAAGTAWQAWAAIVMATPEGREPVVGSVSTGSQSISYDQPVSAYKAALDVSAWHLARTRKGAVASVDLPRDLSDPCANPRMHSTWSGFPGVYRYGRWWP